MVRLDNVTVNLNSGALSDKLQKRKSIALAGYLMAAVAKPLMGLSTTWQGVFGARLLDRLGAGTRSAPRDALIASSVDEKNRGRAFGLEGFGDNAGAFLGPLLAVFLLYALHVGIRAIFYLAIIPGLLAFVMVLLVKERPAEVAAKSKIDVSLRQFPMGYWKYLLATALFGLGNSSNAFLILRTQDIGASLETTILIYAAFNLVAALISYPAGSLSDSWGRKNVLLASFVIFLIAYLGFASRRTSLSSPRCSPSTDCIRGSSALSAKHWRRISCQSIYARAELAGTARPLACYSSWQASLRDCCGIGSAMPPYSITAPSLQCWGALL